MLLRLPPRVRKCVVASRPALLSWKLNHGKIKKKKLSSTLWLKSRDQLEKKKMWSHIKTSPCKLELFVPKKYTNNMIISLSCTLCVTANLLRKSWVEYYLQNKEYQEEISLKWTNPMHALLWYTSAVPVRNGGIYLIFLGLKTELLIHASPENIIKQIKLKVRLKILIFIVIFLQEQTYRCKVFSVSLDNGINIFITLSESWIFYQNQCVDSI